MKNVRLSYLSRNAAAASLPVTSKSEYKADTTKVNIQTAPIHTDMKEVRLLWRTKKKVKRSYCPQATGSGDVTQGVLLYLICCTVMRRVTTAIRSEKCVVWRFRHCANVIEYLFININQLDVLNK